MRPLPCRGFPLALRAMKRSRFFHRPACQRRDSGATAKPRPLAAVMRQKPVRSQPFRRGADYYHAQVVLEAPNEFAKPGFTVRTGTMQVS